MTIRIVSLLTIFLAQTVAGLRAAPATSVTLVEAGEARCAIVVDRRDALLARTAENLAIYLQRHAGAKPPVLAGDAAARTSQSTLIVLDASAERSLLARLGVTLDVPADRDDAYHLKVVTQPQRTIVAIGGHAPTGAKFGAYRLMEELDIVPGRASLGAIDVTASPFFKTRSISLFNIWRVPVALIRQCNLESWPAEKIQRNVAMYDAFGFNALETHDRFHENFLEQVYGIKRREWREKVYAMCDAAHAAGMTVFLRQWGNSVAQPVKELKGGYTPFGFDNLAPDIPAERRRWEVEIRDYVVKNYASHIDHFIGHWADAGGIHAGSNATIKDAMLLHNELQAALRAINPRIETSFNLWNMASPSGHRGWPGYVDHRSVTGGLLAHDVIIAQATRAAGLPYSEKVTREILADGYRAAVWTWRRGDTEVRLGDPGLRIRIHGVMGDYFHALPESARQLEWHNIERNQHGVATDVNFYVAAKLLWDPKTDVDAALNKYCALVFGPTHATAMAEAFLTIEACRDLEAQVSAWTIANPASARDRARAALAAVEKIALAPGHVSRLPSVVSSAEMLGEVRAALAVIADNAALATEALPAIHAWVEAGRLEEAKTRAEPIRKKAEQWAGTLAGGMESVWLRNTLRDTFSLASANAYQPEAGYQVNRIASVKKSDEDLVIRAKDSEVGTAVVELPAPARRRVEFHFRCTVAESGPSRNGGLAFGSALEPDEMIVCQALTGGKKIVITGRNLTHPVRASAPNLDGNRPLDCTVIVDLERRRVTFRVGKDSAEAELKASPREVRYYGAAVNNSQSRFSPIEIKQRD